MSKPNLTMKPKYMPKKAADPAAATPLFRQIVNDLRRRIVNGDVAEHEALPSERVVAESYDVSRMTARRALENIEAEGLAYSKGRMGRFVSPQRLDYNLSSMANFVANAAAQGIEIEMETLASSRTEAGTELAAILAVPAGTAIFRNVRIFRREGHATFLETEAVVVSRCARLLSDGAGQDEQFLQEQRYSPLGHTADIVIRMRALDPDEARMLGLVPYQVGIEQEQLVRDSSGSVFCYCRQIWRGEMAQFSATAILS